MSEHSVFKDLRYIKNKFDEPFLWHERAATERIIDFLERLENLYPKEFEEIEYIKNR